MCMLQVCMSSNERESIVIGWTEMTKSEVKEVVRTMEDRYPGNTYHMLEK